MQDNLIAKDRGMIDVDNMMDVDKEKGLYRVRRDMYTDPDLFEMEMKYIFENNWVYLAHESQVANPNDYFTSYIGRQPVVVVRNKDGELHCFVNACSHRGAVLCRKKVGNKAVFTCPFHGWSFNNSGKLVKVKDPDDAGYPESFNCDGSHDLKRVRLENYRGFLFGSLNDDVKPLTEHLGEAAKIIDMVVDQSPEGIEVLRGASTYTYDGNWKMQAENGADGYHVSAVHWNYVATTARRKTGMSADDVKAMDVSSWNKQKGGFYAFEHGHILLWLSWPNPQDRSLYESRDELVERFGASRADWMIGKLRNLCLYPNMFLMDQMSTQIRHFRPISVDKTEVTIYCFGPKGEAAQERAHRIRQYEDFFNASGMATPDDLEEFRACQEGYNGMKLPWNDMSRGAEHWIDGQDEEAKEIGLHPVMSGVKSEDEGLYIVQHQYWKKVMAEAVRKEKGE
ncbi:benzoate 1,2-dioxygenase large subunit [Marinobacter excellens]|uniref:Benzoate 1,2-dioxygenase alpha subunit n=1 Tax=Marinobacter excellens LAMA 842 TaxID=1306954 RepID=A0A137S348_9GAMM|nr:benzoate 1,2-dioxygenase large subunit [Marinobacter excellens]KXO06849.1 Benzoate 1,2-dioxygenase alpha subunit [Marinobacter excellens LAMA 842]